MPIGDLPLYDQDHEGENEPPAYAPFGAAIAAADAILFVTPEYNRSIPGGLKNAIDVVSRPPGKAAMFGRPAAIISQSPGPMGGFGVNHIIRQSRVPLKMLVLRQPEMYLGQVAKALDDDSTLKDDHVREQMVKFADAFEALIAVSKLRM